MINFESLRLFCTDGKRVENYEIALNDPTETWDIHHRAEILPCGVFSVDDLKAHGLYFNRPPEELIFMKHGEHIRMHMLNRTKLPDTSGEKNSMFGKKHSEESRAKISATRKSRIADGLIHIDTSHCHSKEANAKISAKAKERYKDKRNHPMFGRKPSEETKRKISETKRKKRTK